MPRNPSKLYSYHVKNLREIELAISHTCRLARAAIASGDPQKSLRSLLRLFSFLMGAWAECRLQKLLNEEFGFGKEERLSITSEETQLKQWQRTVDSAFRKHYNISNAPLDKHTLGVSRSAQREELNNVLNNDLRIIIEIRNKLAHGQWVYPFTEDGQKVEARKYVLINKENLQSLQFKYYLLRHLADVIHDLVVSKKAFERDFEDHFRKLFQAKINLEKKAYEKYEKGLVDRRRSARQNIKK